MASDIKFRIPPAELIEEMLAANGEAIVRIYGASMHPLLPEETQVSIETANPRRDKIRLGDIVCFKSDSRLIAHRVVGYFSSQEGSGFLLKGDNCESFDPAHAASEMIGKVATVEGLSLGTFFWKTVGVVVAKLSYWEGTIGRKRFGANGLRRSLSLLVFAMMRRVSLGVRTMASRRLHISPKG